MSVEAIPRLAVTLRSTFPDARIELKKGNVLTLVFPNHPAWDIEVAARPFMDPTGGDFQILQSTVTLRFECLQQTNEHDFLKLLTCENFGLRGVSVLADREGGQRVLRVRGSFLGSKGRTRDEAENAAIDVLSLIRYSRLLQDRILRSSAGGWFSYEMYFSQYFAPTRGRSRYVNYARSVFQGSTERVFGQVTSMLKDDYGYDVELSDPGIARITTAPKDESSPPMELVLRLPYEVPMLTCYVPLHLSSTALSEANQRSRHKRLPGPQLMDLVASLNHATDVGHFEVGPDGHLLSFVTWKHLTNDLRFFSIDHMIGSVHAAQRLINHEIERMSSGSANPQLEDRRRLARRSA